MVNLEWFRTFKAIYEKGTLTAAAQSLFISQPGVSLHLSSLETNVGLKLFERIGKKMVPTEHGKVLYNALLQPIEQLEAVEQKFQRSTVKGIPSLTIGMCFETFQHLLEKHLHSFDFNVITLFSDYQNLMQQLLAGTVDLIIVPQQLDASEIEQTPLFEETIVLIASKDIDQNEFREIEKVGNKKAIQEWLLTHKWYGAATDHTHFNRFWQNNFKTSPNFRQNFIVPNFNSIIRSLELGSGLAIVPDFLCREAVEQQKLQILWHGTTPTRNQLYFAYRKNSIYKPQIGQILETINKEVNP